MKKEKKRSTISNPFSIDLSGDASTTWLSSKSKAQTTQNKKRKNNQSKKDVDDLINKKLDFEMEMNDDNEESDDIQIINDQGIQFTKVRKYNFFFFFCDKFFNLIFKIVSE